MTLSHSFAVATLDFQPPRGWLFKFSNYMQFSLGWLVAACNWQRSLAVASSPGQVVVFKNEGTEGGALEVWV